MRTITIKTLIVLMSFGFTLSPSFADEASPIKAPKKRPAGQKEYKLYVTKTGQMQLRDFHDNSLMEAVTFAEPQVLAQYPSIKIENNQKIPKWILGELSLIITETGQVDIFDYYSGVHITGAAIPKNRLFYAAIVVPEAPGLIKIKLFVKDTGTPFVFNLRYEEKEIDGQKTWGLNIGQEICATLLEG